MNIAVILCSQTKKDYACSAKDLYNDSISFRARRIFVEYGYDEWSVLTSKYGFCHPDKVIEPYSWYIHTGNELRVMNRDTETMTDDMVDEWIEMISNQIPSNADVHFDCHFSKSYYNVFKQVFPNSTWIPQEKVLNKTAWKYHDATLMMVNGATLEEALDFIGTKENKPPRTETSKWFYHYDGTEYYGKSPEVAKQYKVNDFNIWSVSMGDSNMTCGWVTDKSLLPHINKLPSGRYRMDKGYSKKNTNMDRGNIKEHLDKLEQLFF